MIVSFNTAIQDEDYNIIDNRKAIAKNYLLGWFLIDLVAIFPLNLILQSADAT